VNHFAVIKLSCQDNFRFFSKIKDYKNILINVTLIKI